MYNGMCLNIFEGMDYIWIIHVIPFLVVCGMSHKSSRSESYGHEKLENPGLGSGSKFV